MPTYEYECLKCGYNFEAFQKMSDAPLAECPQCKGSVKRLISRGSGLIFKGSGFYVTDYKKSAPAGAGKKSADSGGKKKDSCCSGCPAAGNAGKKCGSE